MRPVAPQSTKQPGTPLRAQGQFERRRDCERLNFRPEQITSRRDAPDDLRIALGIERINARSEASTQVLVRAQRRCVVPL